MISKDFFSLVRDKKLTSVSVVNKEKKLVELFTLSDILHFVNIDSGGGIEK